MQLEQVNVQLDLALNNMSHGLVMFDSNRKLIICNERYAGLYELPVALRKPGTELNAILQYLVDRKTFAETPQETFSSINTIAAADQIVAFTHGVAMEQRRQHRSRLPQAWP